MTKIQLTRDKHILYITRPDSEIKLIYDLKEQRMKKFDKKINDYYPVQHQYKFFESSRISDLEADEHFIKMIELTKKINPNCHSLSTFFGRMNNALVYENYIQEGIETECRVYRGRYDNKYVLTKPLSFYKKNIINFFKKYKVIVDTTIESAFLHNYDLMEQVINALENSNLTTEDKLDFFKTAYSYRTYELQSLVRDYKYDILTLINYIYNYLLPFENIPSNESIRELNDYYRMVNAIGRNMKKYPKYLRSMHDIITANYNAFKRTYDEVLFTQLINYELEYEDKIYSVIVPKNTKEIIQEGTSLSHCVGNYIERILRKEAYIFFMRLTEKKEESLITLEYRQNKLVQAKGQLNRAISKEEYDFLVKYCKIKNIPMELPNGF